MNILIMGAPGTGKGTMSACIKDRYHVVHISTGDMLRQAIADKSDVGLRAQEYMNKGMLVPDEIIHDLILERLKQDDISNGFLFDGYPRTLKQAIDLNDLLVSLNMKLDKVINLDVSDKELENRITGRRVCSDCKKIYHIINFPSKEDGKCDVCGGVLLQRKDDTLEALKTRLDAYYGLTKPVIGYYDDMGIVKNIDASKKVDEVFADIVAVLEA